MAPYRRYADAPPARPFPWSGCEQEGAELKSVQQEAIQVFGDWLEGIPAFVDRHLRAPLM